MYRRLALTLVVLALLLAAAAGWFLLRPTMRITFHVVDHLSQPVVGTTVTAWTFHPGPNSDRAVARVHRATTDQNGHATITLASRKRDLGYRVVRPGHTGITSLQYTFQKASWGRWLPWDPTIQVILRPVQQPVAMYTKSVGDDPADLLPALGQRFGYDLIIGDWVAPHGLGQTPDFYLTATELQKYQTPDQPFETSLILSFPNKADGIQAGSRPRTPGLRPLHKAPETGYAPQLRKFIKKRPGYPLESSDTHPLYYFRTRTQLDEYGHVQSALYGKLEGDLTFDPANPRALKFTYYLNPTPNDRNVQPDHENTLGFQISGQTGTAQKPLPTPSTSATPSPTPAGQGTPAP